MTSKDGIASKVTMSKGGGKGGWLKAPLSEAQEPHGEFSIERSIEIEGRLFAKYRVFLSLYFILTFLFIFFSFVIFVPGSEGMTEMKL